MSSTAAPRGVATQLSSTGLIAVTWVGASLGILFTVARIAIRIKYMRCLLADDYFMLLALAFLIANAILQTLQTPHLYYMILQSTGPDFVDHVVRYTRFEFVIIGVFWSVLWSVKGSFLALFWMLSDGLPRYRRAWWALTVFAVLAYIGCWLGSALNCRPPSNYFKYGKCRTADDQKGAVISISYSTAVDILTDLLIMFLPLSLIWGTRINSRQKIGLAIVFSFGFMIIATAIVRAVEITGKAYSDQAALAVWSIVESSISIIVGCLPPFRSIISSGKSISQYRYGLSSGAPASNPISPNDKLRASTSNWGDASLTVQNQRGYQNMDLEMRPLNQGQVTRHSNYSNDTPRGPDLKIQMVQEFTVVSSK